MIARIIRHAAALAILLLALPARAASPVTIGYQPTIDLIPAFIAAQEGMFARHGLDVTLVGGTGAIQISGLVAHSLNISNPTVPQLLQAIDSGLDLVIIGGANMMSPDAGEFAAVVRTGESLSQAQDFVGRKVGVNTVGAFLHVLFVQWLKNHQVDPSSVTFVEVPFPQMGDVLRQGTVDAVISVQPFVGRMVSAGTGTATDGFVRDFPAGMPVAVYAAERSWAEQHRGEIDRFRAAMREAEQFFAGHGEQGRADTLKYLKMPPQALAAMKIPEISIALAPAGINEWIRIMRGQNLVNGKLDAATILWK